MIELSAGPDHLPLQLASRLLAAPGVWAPDSRLSLSGFGALVTPPLGWRWDGEAAQWEARAGSFVWAPPRRPLDRFARRLAREGETLPYLFTIAPDSPQEVERAIRALDVEGAAGYLLWDATPDTVVAARRGGPALPIIAEAPCNEIAGEVDALRAAGADGLWLGTPRVGQKMERLWGPAVFPLVLSTLADERVQRAGLFLVAGAGVTSGTDARRLREEGAAAVALDPSWWVEPGLAIEVAAAL